jgi:hypothetical protein
MIDDDRDNMSATIKKFRALLTVLTSMKSIIGEFMQDKHAKMKLEQLIGEVQWCINQYESGDTVEDSDDEENNADKITQEISICQEHVANFIDHLQELLPEPRLLTQYGVEHPSQQKKVENDEQDEEMERKSEEPQPKKSPQKQTPKSAEKQTPQSGEKSKHKRKKSLPKQVEKPVEEEKPVKQVEKRSQKTPTQEKPAEEPEKPTNRTKRTGPVISRRTKAVMSESDEAEAVQPPSPKKTKENGTKQATASSSSAKPTASSSSTNEASKKNDRDKRRFKALELHEEAINQGVSDQEWEGVIRQTDKEVGQFLQKRKRSLSQEANGRAAQKRRLMDKHQSAKQMEFKDIADKPDDIEDYSEEEPQKKVPEPKKPKKQGTKKTPWTEVEVRHLLDGVKRFGHGKWANILNAYTFAKVRDSVSLRDKYRNMEKSGLV